MTRTDDSRPADDSVEALRTALARAREERDAALRQVVELEVQRDLGQDLALRFERELEQLRRDVARALNDELGRHAVSIRSMAATFESRLTGREPSLAQLASLMVGNTDAMLATIRSMVQQARPEALEHAGLTEGLRALVADWKLRKPEVRFELLLEPEEADFGLAPAAVESAAYRIVQEAIENAVAHAGARTVVVSVRRDEGAISLQVSDDGRGLSRRHTVEGAGLRTMRELAAAAGGSVTIATGESGGVEVLARLPWPDGAPE